MYSAVSGIRKTSHAHLPRQFFLVFNDDIIQNRAVCAITIQRRMFVFSASDDDARALTCSKRFGYVPLASSHFCREFRSQWHICTMSPRPNLANKTEHLVCLWRGSSLKTGIYNLRWRAHTRGLARIAAYLCKTGGIRFQKAESCHQRKKPSCALLFAFDLQ
ncbi:hypothetical protein TGPRC2_259680, partial [Toxoplasma gondii TgCatPRC2]